MNHLTPTEEICWTDGLPLPFALWWYIENSGSTELFFHLRERVRAYSDDPKKEHYFERKYRELQT